MDILEILKENWKYALFPLLGTLIGWGTNWLALKMLFRPRKPVGIGPYKLQGLIPSRRNDLSGTIAKTISEELLSSKDIVQAMEDLDIKKIALEQVDKIVKKKLESQNFQEVPAISFLQESIIQMVQTIVSNQVEDSIDDFLQNMGEHVSGNLDIVKLIETKLQSLDDERLENIVNEVSERELKHIERLGAVLGFVIGCLQVVIIFLIN